MSSEMMESVYKISPQSEVQLLPWDPDSPAHVERLRRQRKACGWKQEMVEKWSVLQRNGEIALQWIVLTDDDLSRDEHLQKHISAFPSEKRPLLDTATSFGGRPRDASEESFIPIGHISLDSKYEKPEYSSEDKVGLYWIATFYISRALQRYGFGRAAMDLVEEMACQEPLCAKTLALSTRAMNDPNLEERYEAMGKDPAVLSPEFWYSRRGYETYKQVDNMWYDGDRKGKLWPITAVFMKKEIKQ